MAVPARSGDAGEIDRSSQSSRRTAVAICRHARRNSGTANWPDRTAILHEQHLGAGTAWSGKRLGHIQVASALRPAKMTTERSAASGFGPAATTAVRGCA